ncbi:hypothetical protein [Kordia sp.]|uniref:hypothetical protein n=1 Tax=Kordia sp. TaxID=1965332 RepID=UPI0025BF723B|nr:hypothetical protein [Kordia sp.]MCH2196356.1 hypothetical protein [Kordia sp.]
MHETKMKLLRCLKSLFLLLIFTIIFNCEDSQKDKYINIHFIQSGTSFPVSMDCTFSGNENEQIGDLFYKKITDVLFIDKFYNEYKNLEADSENKNHPDNRIMAFVHIDGKKTDTLCFGENHGLMINGIRVNDSEKLLKMLKDKIEYKTTYKSLDEAPRSR